VLAELAAPPGEDSVPCGKVQDVPAGDFHCAGDMHWSSFRGLTRQRSRQDAGRSLESWNRSTDQPINRSTYLDRFDLQYTVESTNLHPGRDHRRVWFRVLLFCDSNRKTSRQGRQGGNSAQHTHLHQYTYHIPIHNYVFFGYSYRRTIHTCAAKVTTLVRLRRYDTTIRPTTKKIFSPRSPLGYPERRCA
jgi:hypothetical protein